MDMAKGKKTKVTLESLSEKIDAKFNTLDAKIDRVIDEMVTHEDLQQLEDRLERKIDQRMSEVIQAIDKLIKPITDLQLEYAAIKTQLTRHEEWFEILAKKMDVKLPI